MTSDFRLPPYITARCDVPAGYDADEDARAQRADQLNDAERVDTVTALERALRDVLSTAPGSSERAQAELRGHQLLRRI